MLTPSGAAFANIAESVSCTPEPTLPESSAALMNQLLDSTEGAGCPAAGNSAAFRKASQPSSFETEQ